MTTLEAIAVRPIANGRDIPTPAELRVYFAICSLYDEAGVVTLRGVRDRIGDAATHWIHCVCYRLRAMGWLSFEDGEHATIRPLRRVELYPEALRKGTVPA